MSEKDDARRKLHVFIQSEYGRELLDAYGAACERAAVARAFEAAEKCREVGHTHLFASCSYYAIGLTDTARQER
jgi:hypothetical protein